ncbi:hypothetical protein CAEBREN_29926 [Caenorhabditis brenneri]|uniref:Uncharacterized protein n=1 Tax=Caenorhabditis brenneri TaxID=135651 RepID=G0PFK4_CAEBE|nr:hypothetical protein CAEBREN_29926 [Caenorhabditis brenneri]
MVKPSKKEKTVVPTAQETDKTVSDSAIFAASEGRIGLRIHAKPGAKKSCVVAIGDSEVDVAIGAPPREGAANEELISYLMQALGLRKNELQFDKGAKSRSKVVLIETKRLTMEEVRQKLQGEIEN